MIRRLSFRAAPLCLALMALTGAASSCRRDGDGGAGVQDQFAGSWRLVSLDEPGADGAPHRADCTGLLVFTRDGRMSVQVMYRNAQAPAGAGPVQYAQGGYEASFGRYAVDERAERFTYRVEGALVRTLVGKELTRIYELSGRQLVVKPVSPEEHWRVTWERG